MFGSYQYSTYDLNLSPLILNRSSNSYTYPIFIIHYTQVASNDKFLNCLENIKKSFPSHTKFNKSSTIDCCNPTFSIGNNICPIINLSSTLSIPNTYSFTNKDKVTDWGYNAIIESFLNQTKGCIFITDDTKYLSPCLLTRSIVSLSDTTDNDILKFLCNKAGSGLETIPALVGTLTPGIFRGVHKGVHWTRYVYY